MVISFLEPEISGLFLHLSAFVTIPALCGGCCRDIGVKSGKYYSVNVPLQENIDDTSYESIFKPVIERVMDVYQPTGTASSSVQM
jgi:acetoin utilization deacetylase AcuC-like enzyme